MTQVWLVVLALLLGASWALQLRQLLVRQVVERLRQTEDPRRLDEERSAVCPARRQRGECPYCASPLSQRDCFLAPKIVEEQPDDD
ncbi:MAG: hypothetical protein ACRDSZ_08275 [Pseudonocardiaceae bacterium]